MILSAQMQTVGTGDDTGHWHVRLLIRSVVSVVTSNRQSIFCQFSLRWQSAV